MVDVDPSTLSNCSLQGMLKYMYTQWDKLLITVNRPSYHYAKGHFKHFKFLYFSISTFYCFSSFFLKNNATTNVELFKCLSPTQTHFTEQTTEVQSTNMTSCVALSYIGQISLHKAHYIAQRQSFLHTCQQWETNC